LLPEQGVLGDELHPRASRVPHDGEQRDDQIQGHEPVDRDAERYECLADPVGS
jgi:hypothetical protein